MVRIAFVICFLLSSACCAEVRRPMPQVTPKLEAYSEALKAIALKSPAALKLAVFSSTHCIPYAEPTILTTKGYTALFVATKLWRESTHVNGIGAYCPKIQSLYLNQELESAPHMGFLVLHELGHCEDAAKGVFDPDSFSGCIETECRSFGLTYRAADDFTDHRFYGAVKRVLENSRMLWDSEKSCSIVTLTQAAQIDMLLGFPRARSMSDHDIRRTFYTVYYNWVMAPSDAARREFIRRWYGYEKKMFKKP